MRKLLVAGAVAASLASPCAHAGLTLTADGVSLGFTLTTFLSGYNAQYGPLAQGIASNGNVITGSLLNNQIYVFRDVDGQTLSNAVTSVPYTCMTGNCNYAMTTAGGSVYGAQAFGGVYQTFANNGTFTPVAGLSNLTSYLGMWGDPVNGHIISASNSGLVDINPIAGTFRVIADIFPDGVSVSPDGTTAWVELGGTIQSFDIASGAHIHTYNTGNSPDGTGVITGGQLNGDVVVNNNNGTMQLIDPSKADGDPLQIRLIATGGTRGDFVSPDVSNGTLFVSQNEAVDRLSCGPNCSIGVPGIPEPETYALMLGGLGMLSLLVRRRRMQGR
jgi:hypothetical protein